MTSKYERLNHLLKATSQGKFCFSLTRIYFVPQFPDPKRGKNVSVSKQKLLGNDFGVYMSNYLLYKFCHEKLDNSYFKIIGIV